MPDSIRIQMMNDFVIFINERHAEHLVSKSRKGAALIQYLIVNRDSPVSNQRLLSTFWSDERVTNPENALKTLVSRLRTMLNDISPDLGTCIVADRGAYHWECLPGMEIDLYELEEIFDSLTDRRADAKCPREVYERMMSLYSGDLLRACETNDWAFARATTLHSQYIMAVQNYIDLLREEGDDQEIVSVCRRALEVDSFNNRLHMELMTALINTQRGSEAMSQYEEVMHLHYHYLNAEPSEGLREFYSQIVASGSSGEYALQSIRGQLKEANSEKEAYVCDYEVFKEIYSIEVQNLSRLGSTIFLGIIMVGQMNGEPMDRMKQGNIMRGLTNILRMNLRKGDVITQFSPTIMAVLLPMVNYRSSDSVMERVKSLFYRQFPNSNVIFDYRICPADEEESELDARLAVNKR